MNPNPFSDVVDFLRNSPSFFGQPVWTTGIFWLLGLASIIIALYAFGTIPSQRRAIYICDFIFRFLIGAMWWQQTLWKLPPYYTDHPDQPFGATGLAYWMGLMGKSAAIPVQADFVNNIVLPHFYVFAPIVYSLESADGGVADAGNICPVLGCHRCAADPQPLARPLQCRGGMAVDIFFPARADGDLCGSPLWTQPRP